MTVQRATAEHVELVAELGHKFITASDAPPASLDECRVFVTGLLAHPNAGVFVSERGVIAGMVAPLYYRPDFLQAVELFWWAEDGQGRPLLDAFEHWAIHTAKVNEIYMSTLEGFTPPAIDVLLLRRGFAASNKTFRKVVR
jgi:hypothetical protein